MQFGIFYYIPVCWIFFQECCIWANNEDPDHMPCSAVIKLGLHYLPRSLWRMLGFNWLRILTIRGLGNTVVPDWTAPKGALWSGSILFAIPSASFGHITVWYRSCSNFRIQLLQLFGYPNFSNLYRRSFMSYMNPIMGKPVYCQLRTTKVQISLHSLISAFVHCLDRILLILAKISRV